MQDPNLILDRSTEGGPLVVLPKGLTQLTFRTQRKRGDDRRDEEGVPFHAADARMPDFRYAVLDMGFGLPGNLEFSFTLPYTWANDFLETPRNFYPRRLYRGQVLERCDGCTGLTDAWGSLKWQALRTERAPLVIQGDFKFPEIYRHSNPYMGSMAHDFQLSAWTFVHNRRAWLSPRIGYLWRGGAFADGVTYAWDMGWRPFRSGHTRTFYLRTRFDGFLARNTGQPAGPRDRFLPRRELVPGHFFTLLDQEGCRMTAAAGVVLAQWNFELAYSRWLAWKNAIGFKEWSLSASRPLVDREFIRGERLVKAPSEAEARSRLPDAVVLAPGEGFMATVLHWKGGSNRHDERGRLVVVPVTDFWQDFRFLAAQFGYGLPKGFEVSALVPYFWGYSPGRSHNGLSDIWLSVRKQILYNSYVPLGVAAEFKFPEAYRHADRFLGELKHDIMLSLFTVKGGTNWWAAPKFGYRWREGAYSDELPYVLDAGYRPPFARRSREFYLKTVFEGNFSLNNASPAGPGDRFGDRQLILRPDYYFTVNEGAQHRAGFGFGVRLIRNWNVEFVNYEYLAWKNNYGFERDWAIGLARWF